MRAGSEAAAGCPIPKITQVASSGGASSETADRIQRAADDLDRARSPLKSTGST